MRVAMDMSTGVAIAVTSAADANVARTWASADNEGSSPAAWR